MPPSSNITRDPAKKRHGRQSSDSTSPASVPGGNPKGGIADAYSEAEQSFALRRLDFNGADVAVLVDGDRQRWSAATVSTAMGYDRPQRLGNLIRNEWSAEFIEGKDFEVVTSADVSRYHGLTSPRAPSVMLLTETGILLALCKSDRPAGVRFRRWLVDVALPALRGVAVAPVPAIDATRLRAINALARLAPAKSAERLAMVRAGMAALGVDLPAAPIERVAPVEAVRRAIGNATEVSASDVARRTGASIYAVTGALRRLGFARVASHNVAQPWRKAVS